MFKALFRVYRAAATGFCFAVFGLGGIFFGLTVFPLIRFAVRNHRLRYLISKRLVSWSFRFFIEMMRAVRVLNYSIEGAERLKRGGQLILSNHPSLIDVVFLIAFIPQADCIVKTGASRNPFMYFPITAANFICNDSADAVVNESLRSMDQDGNCLLIFPEGTRTVPGKSFSARRGAAQIAVRCKKNVTPVIIRASSTNLHKQASWWKPPRAIMNYRIEVKDTIKIQPFLKQGLALNARKFNSHLELFFRKQLHASSPT